MEDSEIWKDIPNLPGYQVSDLGRVRSRDRTVKTKNGVLRSYKGRILKPNVNGHRAQVQLGHDGDKQSVRDLVAEAFIGPKPPGMVTVNINGDLLDNRVENIAYMTYSELAKRRPKQPRKEVCPSGHPYSGDNVTINSQGRQVCRECGRLAWRRWYDRHHREKNV